MAEKSKSNRLVTIVVGIWIGVCVGAVAVAAVIMFGPSILQRGGMEGLETDVAAPDFELVDLSGNTVRLQDFRGQAVVVGGDAGFVMSSFGLPGAGHVCARCPCSRNIPSYILIRWL